MLKRTLVLTLLWMLSASAVPAQAFPDSLRRQMEPGQDYETRIQAYLRYVAYYELKNFDTAIQSADQGITLARKNGDSLRVAILKKSSGIAHYFRGSYDVAAASYHDAIAILEKTGDKRILAEAYNEMAKLYRKTRDLDRSLENYNQADRIFRELRDTAGIAMILNESGVVFEYRKDYAGALRRYTASKELDEATGDSLGVSYALSNMAGIFVLQGKYNEAEKNHLRALAIRRALNDNFATALTYSDLGATLHARGDYPGAISYLLQSNHIAEAMKYPELLSHNYNELSAIAQKQGDYKQALTYFRQRTALRDSLFSLEKTRQIEELNTRYETVKKENTIVRQRNKITRQNFLFLGIAGLALFTGLLLYSQYRRYALKKETQLQAEIMKQQELSARAVMEAEESERQRIARDLHDGVGQMMSAARMNLSAFESEIQFDGPRQKESFEKVIRLVDDSCREVRTVSHIMMPNALLKNNLAAAIHAFVDKLDKNSLQVHVYTEGIDEGLDSHTSLVLYRVLQECVNNTLKHAGAGRLDISVIRDKDGLHATVEDNGKGFDLSDKDNTEGMGLRNIRTRVGYLKGTVDIDSSPGKGTMVAVHVPLPS